MVSNLHPFKLDFTLESRKSLLVPNPVNRAVVLDGGNLD
jgi:hypothetical protein